jgi:hypothetical protein
MVTSESFAATGPLSSSAMTSPSFTSCPSGTIEAIFVW